MVHVVECFIFLNQILNQPNINVSFTYRTLANHTQKNLIRAMTHSFFQTVDHIIIFCNFLLIFFCMKCTSNTWLSWQGNAELFLFLLKCTLALMTKISFIISCRIVAVTHLVPNALGPQTFGPPQLVPNWLVLWKNGP